MAIPERSLTTQRPELVASAVRSALSGKPQKHREPAFHGHQSPVDQTGIFPRQVTGEFVHAPERDYRPGWLNFDGLLQMTTELTGPSFWSSLRSGPINLKLGVEEHVNVLYSNDEVLGTVGAHYTSGAVTLGLLAAAMGRNVDSVISQSDTMRLDTQFAKAIGEKYGDPAADIEEFMKRVDELLPASDPSGEKGPQDKQGSLIKYLIDLKAFEGEPVTTGEKTIIKTCPAIPMVEVMLETWGQELRSPVYREKFKNAINIPEDQRTLRMSGGKSH